MPLPHRILIVDDDPELREYLRRALEGDASVVCREAGDGEAALAVAVAFHPHLIICDLVLPRLDGLGVVARLRERSETARIPILLVTGVGVDRSLRARVEADPDLHLLPKPFNASRIRGMVARLLPRL